MTKTNAAAITVTTLGEHIIPVLQQLHCSPLESQINFNYLILAFKCGS